VLCNPCLSSGLEGVPGGAEGWGVGEVEVGESLDGHVVEDGGGGDVDSFGDLGAQTADELESQKPAGAAVAGVEH